MITEFGKFMRKLRIDKDLRLIDVAKMLNVSSSFLSSVELGKKNIPSEWISLIPEKLCIDDKEKLYDAISKSIYTIEITDKKLIDENMYEFINVIRRNK